MTSRLWFVSRYNSHNFTQLSTAIERPLKPWLMWRSTSVNFDVRLTSRCSASLWDVTSHWRALKKCMSWSGSWMFVMYVEFEAFDWCSCQRAHSADAVGCSPASYIWKLLLWEMIQSMQWSWRSSYVDSWRQHCSLFRMYGECGLRSGLSHGKWRLNIRWMRCKFSSPLHWRNLLKSCSSRNCSLHIY